MYISFLMKKFENEKTNILKNKICKTITPPIIFEIESPIGIKTPKI